MTRIKPTSALFATAFASVLAFSGFGIANASTIPLPMPGPFGLFIQSLSQELTSLATTVAGFAESFTTQQLSFTHGEGSEIDVQTLCIGHTCINEAQLQALLAGQSVPPEGSSVIESSNALEASDTPPVIQINGDNPAVIQVGDIYTDLGATIAGPTADLNLGIATFVNGTPMDPVLIDTSATATDMIDYVATDQNGLTSTSTRTVIIEAPSIIPTDNASTTVSSSTAP